MRTCIKISAFLLIGLIFLLAGCNSDDPCLDTVEPQKEINFRISYEMPVSPTEVVHQVTFKSRKVYCEGDVKGEFENSTACGFYTGYLAEWPATLTYKFHNSMDQVVIECLALNLAALDVALEETKVITYDMVTPGVTQLVEFVSY